MFAKGAGSDFGEVHMKVRWAAMVAAGIATAASFGVGGAGAASATAPALHVKNGSEWVVIIVSDGGGCEIATFDSGGTFKADRFKDRGTWSGGGATLTMKWTKGSSDGMKFKGTYHASAKAYEGSFTGSFTGTGGVVKGTDPSC
jgi:hypothetical protein